MSLGPVDILPARASPFVWSIAYDGKSMKMVGYVPNEIVRETLVGTAKAALPGVAILDTLTIASGAPAGFVEAATFAISTMNRMNEGGVTLDGLNLDVSGSAKTVQDYEVLLSALGNALPDGVKVVSAAIEPAVVSPYSWQGQRTESGVVLSGYVPSIAARDDVAAAAKSLFAGAKVDDGVRIAAGEPRMDWVGAIKFAMSELARLKTGKVALGDKSFAIAGEAASAADYSALVDANSKTLPASLALAQNDIAAPRVATYRFVAERTATGIAIDGNVPGDADRDAILASVARKFGHSDVTGALAYASGAPDGFVPAAQAALQALNRMAGGRVEIADTDVTVTGFAYRPSGASEIADGLAASLPDGFEVEEGRRSGPPGRPAGYARGMPRQSAGGPPDRPHHVRRQQGRHRRRQRRRARSRRARSWRAAPMRRSRSAPTRIIRAPPRAIAIARKAAPRRSSTILSGRESGASGSPPSATARTSPSRTTTRTLAAMRTVASSSRSRFRTQVEMIYLFFAYWPFMLGALLLGVAVGWWYQDPRSADDVDAWLEPGAGEP